MSRRRSPHVEDQQFCERHQILNEDAATCWCGVLHAPEPVPCDDACPLGGL